MEGRVNGDSFLDSGQSVSGQPNGSSKEYGV